MKLFLASSAHYTLDLILPLLPDKPNKLNVVFITTAADQYIDKSWMYADRDKLVDMGFAVQDYDLKGKSEEVLRKDLSKYQIIFVSGGNTFYLLNEVRKGGFDIIVKELLDKGVVYIGSSAGSIIMCPDIEFARSLDMPVPSMSDFAGLDLCHELIIPHYGIERYQERHAKLLESLRAKNLPYPITPLGDDQAVIVNGSQIEIVTNKESHASQNN